MIEDIIEWRHYFHQHPELEFDTSNTAAKVASLLKSFGLEVHESIGRTGVVGVLRAGQSDRAIGLRADMDALPITEQNQFSHRSLEKGKMHACGHDGHMSMLLGAACVLSQNPDFDGTVYFIFQPNEERGLGAQAMIDDGLFERFSMQAVYGMHNMPGLEAGVISLKSGPIMAAEDNFRLVILGRGGHSSQPHQCVDPIVIGAQIVNGFQTIPSRMINPLSPVVVSVTDFKTDGQTNVIASTVEITGDCRCFDEATQDLLAEKMETLVQSMCQAYGAEYEFNYTKVFYPTVNAPRESHQAHLAAKVACGEDRVIWECDPITASEDFSSMLRVKPGAYVLIGNGVDSQGGCTLHHAEYDFNDSIIQAGVDYWTQLVKLELNNA